MPSPILHTEFTDNGLSITFSTLQADLILRSVTAPKTSLVIQLTPTHVIVTIANNHQSISWDETQALNAGYTLKDLYTALVSIFTSI